MIAGTVNAGLEATLTLTIVGPGRRQDITVVIDTGYSGSLTLPIAVVSALSLPPLTPMAVTLADGSRKSVQRYSAAVLWVGRLRAVRILCVEAPPLLGTALLRDHELTAQFTASGRVGISRLP